MPIIAILNLGRLGKTVTLPVFPNCRRPSQTTGEVFLRSEISNITDHLRYISIFPTYEKPALVYHWRPITFSFVLPSHFYFVGFDLFHDIRFKSVFFSFWFLETLLQFMNLPFVCQKLFELCLRNGKTFRMQRLMNRVDSVTNTVSEASKYFW